MNPQKVRQSYFLDPILANSKGHELLADTLIAFLESEICTVWDSAALEADLAFYGASSASASSIIPLSNDDSPSLLSGKGLRKAGDSWDSNELGTPSDSSRTPLAGSRSAYLGIPPFRIGDKPHTLGHFREIKPNCASANDLINPLPSTVFAGSGWSPVVPKLDDEDERHYWYTDSTFQFQIDTFVPKFENRHSD